MSLGEMMGSRFPSNQSYPAPAVTRQLPKNFTSYTHYKLKAINYLLVIAAVSLVASIIIYIILYDRDIKHKNNTEKNLGLSSLVLLGIGILILIPIIYLSVSSYRRTVMEDEIISDLTIVGAEKPTLTELQNKQYIVRVANASRL